jgi:phosphoribosyl-ATP pyrophosphohydrolase
VIVPSIDLRNGNAVQLEQGAELKLDAGDPRPIAERFRVAGEIAVVDLDAALGTGDNGAVIEELCRLAPCRVGGGIRSADAAKRWFDAGATKVVLGTAATPEVLSQLPRERVVAALDARDGEVVVEGWTKGTGRGIADRMRELRDVAGGFLVTFVEREGKLGGTAWDRIDELVEAAGDARLTIAGGVTTTEEIAKLDALGCDAQVGMALYTGRMGLAEAIAAPLTSDRADGLWATVVADEAGVALGLAWSDVESLTAAVEQRRGIYPSRSRGLWVKGERSGATQELLAIGLDCDRFTVRQAGGGFCHEDTWSCWGDAPGIGALERLAIERATDAPEGSYTRRLLEDPELLAKKLLEEAGELAAANGAGEVTHEAADLLYFTLVAMAKAGVSLADVTAELERRHRTVTRRPGNAKS